MRILILNNFSYITGGADRHCFDLAQILRAAGHQVAFLSTSAPQNVESGGAFVPLRVTNATRDELSFRGRARVAMHAMWSRHAHGAMNRLLRDFRPDVAHSHKLYPHLSLAPILAATARNVPVVQTVHDYEFVSASALDDTGSHVDRQEVRLQYRMLNTALFQVKTRWHVPAVGAWITVSRAVQETYAQHGIESVAVPNFTMTGTDAVPGFSDRGGILYAGRLTTAKGVEDLIEVARRLPELSMRVAGHGPLEAVVRAAASELANLEYLGSLSQDDVQRELRNSRVCVMPSRWREPGPLACLEAMAAGTPVVAYRAGGLAEYVEDAGAGRVVANDARALAAACSALHADRSAWEGMSDNAAAAIRGRHSPKTYLASILDIYEQAAGASEPHAV